MITLQSFSPHIEVYSIDEMFLSLHGIKSDPAEYGQSIKSRVWQHTRMSVGVGIAPTKTLAKLASRVAKKIPALQGVCVLDLPDKWEWVLRRIPVTAIWGVGKRMAVRLAALGITTGWDLATADSKQVRKHSNVVLERTMEELNGRSCLALEEAPPLKKQIYCTRSFGEKAKSLPPLLEAVSTYSGRAAEKLRKQQHLVVSMHVFFHTSPHQPNYHAASDIVQLPYPTDDTRVITAIARDTVTRLYAEDHAYLKAGIGLVELVDKKHRQLDILHEGQSEKASKLMSLIDTVNRQEGKGTLFLGAQGVSKTWYMRQDYLSPGYTTRWEDIPVSVC